MAWRDDYVDEEEFLAVRDAARRAYERAVEIASPWIQRGLVAAAGQSISDAEWMALTEELSDAYGDVYLDAIINAGAELGVMPSDDDLLTILAQHESAVEQFASSLRGMLDMFGEDAIRKGISSAEITERLMEASNSPLNPNRADTFARTATNTAVNQGFESSFRAAGLAMKSWITQRDDRVRESHGVVDRDVVPAGEEFMVGGYPARYPGDPQLPIEQRINCRCILGWVDGGGVRRALTAKKSDLYSMARQLNIPGRSRMNRAELQVAVVQDLCLQGLAAGTDCTNRLDEMNMAALLTYGRLGNVRGRYRMRKPQLLAAVAEVFTNVVTVGLSLEQFHYRGQHNQKDHAGKGVKYREDGRPIRTFEAGDRPSIFDRRQAERWRAEREATRDWARRNQVVQSVDRAQLERHSATYGRGVEEMFPGDAVTAEPFPMATDTEVDRAAVEDELSRPVRLQKFDPRTLTATEPTVLRQGVEFYLAQTRTGASWRATGRTYADQDQPENRYPVIYRNPGTRELVIVGGHARAAAAIADGRAVDGILVDPTIRVIR